MSGQVAFNISISLAVLLVAYLLVRPGMRRASEDVTATPVGETLFKRVFEAAPDPTLIADNSGRITLANQQVSALFGYSQDELVGQPIEVLDPRPTFGASMFSTEPGTTSRQLCDRWVPGSCSSIVLHDGAEFPVEISLSASGHRGGESRHQPCAAFPILRARDPRRQFLEFISHDLKNPLSVFALQSRVLAQSWPAGNCQTRQTPSRSSRRALPSLMG